MTDLLSDLHEQQGGKDHVCEKGNKNIGNNANAGWRSQLCIASGIGRTEMDDSGWVKTISQWHDMAYQKRKRHPACAYSRVLDGLPSLEKQIPDFSKTYRTIAVCLRHHYPENGWCCR
jgi:hypothetical protein